MREDRTARSLLAAAVTISSLGVAALLAPPPSPASTGDESTAATSVTTGPVQAVPPSALARQGEPTAPAEPRVRSRPPNPRPAALPTPVPAVPTPSPATSDTRAVTSRPAPWSVDVHAGFGVWIDVFDWSLSHGGPVPSVTLETIDQLAAEGVQTVYLQTARITAPDAVLERELLQTLIDRIHDHGMYVVAWYLPTFVDLDDDWRRIEAALALDVDGFALDIESQEVEDPAERTRRLLTLSQRLRDAAGDRALVANVLPPVPLEDLNRGIWPGFPWAELDQLYDVWMPMAYFTFRGPGNGEQWRDAEAYTVENIQRIRARVGDPDALVHLIGGIADRTTVADVEGMTRGALRSGAMGLSLYDVATTGPELWAPMRAWRALTR